MISKRKNIYLSLICFVAIIGIFIVDGYMGIYDTVRMTIGRHEWEIEFEPQEFIHPTWRARWGERISFSYEIDNRRLSTYMADIEVSVRFMNERADDLTLISQRMSIGAFRKGRIEWVVDTIELFPTPPQPKQEYLATIKIERGEIERKVPLRIYR